jgi:hypothetical protein
MGKGTTMAYIYIGNRLKGLTKTTKNLGQGNVFRPRFELKSRSTVHLAQMFGVHFLNSLKPSG